MNNEKRKYTTVFLITLGIFIVVFVLVNSFNKQKIANIDDLQRKITADLIATETQFELLKTAPCSALGNTILSRELGEFGRKLDFAQDAQGADDPDVIQLKKYYSLLQVKDYLLMQELAEKCESDIESLLYFYTPECDDCRKQGYVLTEFKEAYPELRIYSFDSSLDFSVIDTFASLYNFKNIYPTLIVREDIHQGFLDRKRLDELFSKMISEHQRKERVDKGIEFILDASDYSELTELDIQFVSEKREVLSYLLLIAGGEDEMIEVIFDSKIGEYKFK